jgi:hypothetical protein
VDRERLYEPGGLILTSLDRASLWVIDIDARTRYPVRDLRPCPFNCHLSPDFSRIIYPDGRAGQTLSVALDGTSPLVIAGLATDVTYWSGQTLLIWESAWRAYLQEADQSRQELDSSDIITIQPGGFWGVGVDYQDGEFTRYLTNLAIRRAPDTPRVTLGPDLNYFRSLAWSPDGARLAYVSPVMQNGNVGAEIFLADVQLRTIQRISSLHDSLGPVRVGGQSLQGLSWSPDGRLIAFWAMALTGPDPEIDVSDGVLVIVDTSTGTQRQYCGVSLALHTPNPPRLLWSPDGTRLAFAADLPDDPRGALLLALDPESGVFTVLSDGISRAVGGIPNVLFWGRRP